MTIAHVFRRYGYEAASLSVIGRETGLGKSSLYHHFPGGKVDMAAAVLDLAEAFVRDEVMAPLESEGPREERVGRFLGLLSDYYEAGRTGCLYSVLTLHDCPEDVRVRVSQLTKDWLSMIARDLSANGKPDPTGNASRILRAIQGGLLLTQATGEECHFEQALSDAKALML